MRQDEEVEIKNSIYVPNLELIGMRLIDLLQLYLEKALHISRRPKIFK